MSDNAREWCAQRQIDKKIEKTMQGNASLTAIGSGAALRPLPAFPEKQCKRNN
jgi:hypothetical protein